MYQELSLLYMRTFYTEYQSLFVYVFQRCQSVYYLFTMCYLCVRCDDSNIQCNLVPMAFCILFELLTELWCKQLALNRFVYICYY